MNIVTSDNLLSKFIIVIKKEINIITHMTLKLEFKVST
jgi:hypothetical protein